MDAGPQLSVVIPVYDEADSLEPLHRELDAALARVSGSAEILFVDDASRDASPERLQALAAKDPRIRVLVLASHAGQSAALAAGFEAARGELVATLDADLQNDPADLPRLLEGLGRADVVNGVRVQRRDPWLRIAASRVANRVRNALTGDDVADVGCSLRVMRAEFLHRVKPFDGWHRFLPTLMRLEGARVIEVPVGHRPRRFGHSKVGIAERLSVVVADLLAVRWMLRRRLRYRVSERDSQAAPRVWSSTNRR